jgi:hypothetical protein
MTDNKSRKAASEWSNDDQQRNQAADPRSRGGYPASLLAARAIKALGNITMPVGIDEPLVHTDRADVATVFRFFGEVLVAPLERAADVMDRVARDAQ